MIRNDGITALMWACRYGHTNMPEMLLVRGASVEVAASNGFTALMLACQNDHLDMAELLLRYGASVNVVRDDGFTALMSACQNGHAEVVELLLQRDASVDVTRDDGFTALMSACQEGYSEVAQLLLTHGANVNMKRSDGSTALMLACQNGFTEVAELLLKNGASVNVAASNGVTSLILACLAAQYDVAKLLLSHGASVDVSDIDGCTALMIACRSGYSDVAALLLEHGAIADMTSAGGFTSLMLACENGHAQVVDVLLSHGASVRATNANVETALMVAARAGHFGLVKRLIDAGASTHVCAADGETPFTAAAQWGHLETIQMFSSFEYLTRQTEANLPASLISSTLQSLRKCRLQVYEFEAIWSSVVRRFVSIYAHFEQEKERLPESSFCQYLMIVARFTKLRAKCGASNIFIRLVVSRTFVSSIEDIQGEIDYFLQGAELDKLDIADSDWKVTWEISCEHLLDEFRRVFDDDDLVSQNLGGEVDQAEVISLLQNELQVRSGQCSAGLLALLNKAYSAALRCSSVSVAELPQWFLSIYEIDLEKTTANAHSVLRGKWLNSAVTVLQLDVPSEEFTAEADKWFPLSHPHVVKLFGASHLRPPFSAVCENVLGTNLREYLSVDENRHLLWSKLHEVALGLKYLHDCGVILGNLMCSNIWIGTDGLAKIFGLGMNASAKHSRREQYSARWKSLECLRGEPATAASNVYSLGMCIVEAVSGDIPWSDERDHHVASLLNRGYRPRLPHYIDESQLRLIEKMWLYNPSKRANIASVAEHLREFAKRSDRSNTKFGARLYTKLERVSTSTNLEEYVFPGFGTTIRNFLEWLKSKCGMSRDSRAPVFYILERLDAVYATLMESHRRPRDIAVAKFCEALLSFGSLLRTTVSEKSVLLQAKQQRVLLENNVLHEQIDDVLELLVAKDSADSVHNWKEKVKQYRAEGFSDYVEEERWWGGEFGGSVKLVEYDSERINRTFQPLHLNAGSLQTPNPDAQVYSWLIPLHQLLYNQDDAIGEGAFGSVYRATWLGTPVVLKFMGYAEDGGEYTRRLFFHELRIWYPLNHPHVIKLYGAGNIGQRYFVCEFAPNGALLGYLRRDGNQTKTWQKLYEVALGLQYLHEQNIVHNDLNCSNFLVGADEGVKISDFGLSCIPNVTEVQIDTKYQGAVGWKSPEYLIGERSTLASDVYSFGMCILEAVTGRSPWGSMVNAAVRYQVLKRGNLPLRPDALTDNQWYLVEMMCARDPSRRLRISSIIERLHEFAQQERLEENSTALRVYLSKLYMT